MIAVSTHVFYGPSGRVPTIADLFTYICVSAENKNFIPSDSALPSSLLTMRFRLSLLFLLTSALLCYYKVQDGWEKIVSSLRISHALSLSS